MTTTTQLLNKSEAALRIAEHGETLNETGHGLYLDLNEDWRSRQLGATLRTGALLAALRRGYKLTIVDIDTEAPAYSVKPHARYGELTVDAVIDILNNRTEEQVVFHPEKQETYWTDLSEAEKRLAVEDDWIFGYDFIAGNIILTAPDCAAPDKATFAAYEAQLNKM